MHNTGQIWRGENRFRRRRQKRPKQLDGDTKTVSLNPVIEVTSKFLKEETKQLLDRVRRGERFKIVRDGVLDAYLVPATESVDPGWDEIMAEVRAMRAKGAKTRPNPVLAGRKKRNHVFGLR